MRSTAIPCSPPLTASLLPARPPAQRKRAIFIPITWAQRMSLPMKTTTWCRHSITIRMAPQGSQALRARTKKRKFIGQFGDDSGLSYLNARYYSSDRGQFISQDPTFWVDPKQQNLTDPQSFNSGRTMGGSNSAFGSGRNGNTALRGNSTFSWAKYLADPQQQNSYSYARNNPINMKDPEGLWGVFVSGNVGGDAGLGEGFSGSLQSGIGFTAGNSPSAPVDVGGFSSYGGLVGGPFQSVTVEGVKGIKNSPYTVFGLAGGISGGITLTNATRISQLAGVSTSYNVNIGIGSVNWSRSSDGIWTVSLSIGAKPVASFSAYPTATITSTAKSTGGTSSTGPGNAHTACGTICQ
jgi:RHS repeat-associated protein